VRGLWRPRKGEEKPSTEKKTSWEEKETMGTFYDHGEKRLKGEKKKKLMKGSPGIKDRRRKTG